MEQIDFQKRIKLETEYLELLKEEIKVKSKYATQIAVRHNKTIHEEIKLVETKKEIYKLQIEITSKENFVNNLKLHVEQS